MKRLCWLLPVFLISACNWFEIPESEEELIPEESLTMSQLEVPEGFNFETTREVTLRLSAVDNQGKGLKQVPFRLFLPGTDSLHLLTSGMIGAEGSFEMTIPVNVNQEHLLLTTTFPGLPDAYWLPLDKAALTVEMGRYEGEEPPPGITPRATEGELTTLNPYVDFRNNNFQYIGSYNSQGVPNYLEPVNDNVGQDILNLVANSLPEGQPVPSYNPQYIADGINANTQLSETADIWVTFIHEGAGYRNALGYYTYSTSNPPASAAEINDFYIIFPNVSFSGSGGGLVTGNKVFLGNFPAGTSIGWFLVPDGWVAASQTVEVNNKPVKYSNRNLNTFTSEEYRSHVVLLQDQANQLLLLGFEDISRPGGDNDFNDAVFYITASPFSAVQTTGLPSTQTTSNDSDGDGVPNNSDDFINDPDIAFTNYVPGAGQFATLAFEDQWPRTGDYDMNDLVIDYNFAEYRNSQNKVIKLRGTFILKAMGAGLRNGFGFQLNLPPSAVASVNGTSIQENYIQLAANGVESGQSKATIIVFDNGYKLMSNPGGGFVNTQPGSAFVEPATLLVDIDLTSPQTSGAVGVAPYNPFLISGMQRGVEVHLPDQPPTSKADPSLFGTQQDDSAAGLGRYYKTQGNHPWAIHIATYFDWPVEKAPVNTAYLQFNTWAQSGGQNSSDWFYDIIGYRDQAKIY